MAFVAGPTQIGEHELFCRTDLQAFGFLGRPPGPGLLINKIS